MMPRSQFSPTLCLIILYLQQVQRDKLPMRSGNVEDSQTCLSNKVHLNFRSNIQIYVKKCQEYFQWDLLRVNEHSSGFIVYFV